MIACVVGARPNFIKISPLISEISCRGLDYRIIHTGQHYDYEMNEVFFKDLDIPSPDVYLEVGSGSHAEQTGLAMIKLETEFKKLTPDLVIVVGDVNSTLAGALAAVKLNVPVAHIEAGYRSFDRRMPEEINRVLVDHMCEYLFAPTRDAVENLHYEGIAQEKVFYVGNIMAETLLQNLSKIQKLEKYIQLGVKRRQYAVATIHRPENTDDITKLTEIIESFSQAPLPVVLPLHPRTIKKIREFNLEARLNSRIIPTQPLSYMEMLNVMENAKLVITDSGGVQEEACMLNVPCLTIRENTERVTTVNLGANQLINADKVLILGEINKVIEDIPAVWKAPVKWDDKVAKRIMDVIKGIEIGSTQPGSNG